MKKFFFINVAYKRYLAIHSRSGASTFLSWPTSWSWHGTVFILRLTEVNPINIRYKGWENSDMDASKEALLKQKLNLGNVFIQIEADLLYWSHFGVHTILSKKFFGMNQHWSKWPNFEEFKNQSYRPLGQALKIRLVLK